MRFQKFTDTCGRGLREGSGSYFCQGIQGAHCIESSVPP